jgi:hypothetical protein
MLVTWFGPGAIALPVGQDWKPEMLTVYDKGRCPVAQYRKDDGPTASFILFENLSGKPELDLAGSLGKAPCIGQDISALPPSTLHVTESLAIRPWSLGPRTVSSVRRYNAIILQRLRVWQEAIMNPSRPTLLGEFGRSTRA